MTTAYIAVGSNIRPVDNVHEALQRLSLLETLTALSTVYRTPALERPEQPPYYNCVAAIQTNAGPEDLKYGLLRRIEEKMGRTRGEDPFAERTIDLDLIWFGESVVITQSLTLPDPHIVERPYLAIPLCEVAPDLSFPGGLRISSVAAGMSKDGLEALTSYTDLLKKELLNGAE